MKKEIGIPLDNLMLLELSLEHTQAAIIIADKNGTLTYINEYARTMYGLPNEKILLENWSNYFTALHLDSKTPIEIEELPLFRLLKGEKVHDYELCVRKENNPQLKYYIVNGNTIVDQDNQLLGVVLVAVDITERKENYDQLIHSSPEPILIHRDGMIIGGNAIALEAIGGKVMDQLMGRKIWDFIHPESRESVFTRIERVNKGQRIETIPQRIVRLDNESREIETSTVKIVYQGQPALMTMWKDVTEREKIRRQLEESRQKYQSLFEHHPDAVLMCDLEGNFLSANQSCEKVSGYKPDELVGKLFFPLIVSKDLAHVTKQFHNTIKGTSQEFYCSIIHKKGHVVSVHVTNVPIVVDGKTMGVYSIVQDKTEQIELEEKIKHMAYYDSLTNLPNRQLLNERIKEVLIEAEQNNKSFAVLFIDLDRFKFINDTLGHGVGDQLLQQVAKRLQYSIREGDMVSRLGGDEFIILLTNVDKENVYTVAQRIIEQFSTPFELECEKETYISPSIGISMYPEDAQDIESMLKFADTAMYMAKARGRNNFQYYVNEMNDILQRKALIEKSLRKAIQKEELELHYQPIIDLQDDGLIGAEVLLRWTHPEMGAISPGEFIPIAEECGLIQKIGEWVLKEACKQNKIWQNKGYKLRINVNVSVRQLQDKSFPHLVKSILDEEGLDAQYLVLEITESIMHDPSDSVLVLKQLKELGLDIALDDFGTGYSSLSYLKHLPIDRIKIDRSFIQDIITNSNAASMVKSMIDIGRNLNLRIVAEGIETEEQYLVLKEMQCTKGQGYYICEPINAKKFERKILKKL